MTLTRTAVDHPDRTVWDVPAALLALVTMAAQAIGLLGLLTTECGI
jgi:hypothetical protein